MSEATDQGEQSPEATHSPSDWAKKLRESSKTAPKEDEQPDTPQAEEAELDEEEKSEPESEEPTADEENAEADEEETEEEGLDEDETEPSETEPELTAIAADDTYLIDGEEIDGQTLLNGIEATKNFAQEKHRIRTEGQAVIDAEVAETQKTRDEYANATTFILGMNQQAMEQINNQLNQTSDLQEFHALRSQQANMVKSQQQLQGQFDHFLTQVKKEQEQQMRTAADKSKNILFDTHGGEEGWQKRYPQLKATAEKHGFNNAEFSNLTDHRMMDLFDKLDKAESKISEMESVATKKTKNTVKEKKRRNAQRTNTLGSRITSDAKDRFQKSHKPSDAAAWLLASSGGRKAR